MYYMGVSIVFFVTRAILLFTAMFTKKNYIAYYSVYRDCCGVFNETYMYT